MLLSVAKIRGLQMRAANNEISITVDPCSFLDANGAPLSGGKLYTYLTGTSTPKATYSDSSGTLNANPVILDAEGYTDIWLDNDADYRFRLENSAGVLQWQRDDISPTGAAAAGDSTILGNSGKPQNGCWCLAADDKAGGGWALIDDANHKPVNCTGAISVDTDGNLKVEYGFTAVNKSGFVVGVDETFAELGIQVGASVGNSFAIFRLMQRMVARLASVAWHRKRRSARSSTSRHTPQETIRS